MTTSSFINEIVAGLSQEELDKGIALSTYFKGQSEDKGSSTSYVDSNLDSGEILPWGVQAVWDGQDLSKYPDGSNNNFGEGSYAFVIDSGVQQLSDLNIEDNGWSKSWISNEDPFTDGNGHGTHVAGTIAAKVDGKGVIGVAPGALITSLKVFNSSGAGASYSTVLSAIDYAANIIIENNLPKEKCVINLSLGGPSSPAIDQAVKNIAALGIQFSIAAGNEAQDADNVSPAGAGDAENVYTVSAADNKYEMASFSNWDDPNNGDDVDFAAPGVNVLSYYKNGQLAYLSGTSMAAPAVAGLLITGGVESGEMVTPNGAGYADPFALTTLEEETENTPIDETPEEETPEEEIPVEDTDQIVEFLGNASGDYGSFYLSSGSGSVGQWVLENGLELSSGTLDGNLNNTKSASNATEGSSVKITGTAQAGDTFSFKYAFTTNDYLPYADFSFYSVNNKAIALGALGKNVSDYGSIQENIEYTFTTADFNGNNSGTYTIGFGVVDSKDTIVDSYLQISEFFLDSSDPGTDNPDEETPGDDETIEEPNYSFEYSKYGNTIGAAGTFELTTGYSSISQYNIEQSLELSLGTLDGSLGGSKGSINATEGSALKAITNANAGDTISFDYSFSTNDYQPYKDFGFFSINGTTKKIAAVGEDVPNFGSKVGSITYTLTEQDFSSDQSNKVVLGIGVMDALDTIVDTKLSVQNIQISSSAGDDSENETSPPTETEFGFESSTNYDLYGSVTNNGNSYTLNTSYGSQNQYSLESNLGLISSTLDSNLSGTKSVINSTEGSALKAEGYGQAGDSISFEYVFSTNDYTPFKDFSFYSINNSAYKIVAIGEDVPNYGSKSGNIIYTLKESDLGTDNSFSLAVGVMDALDTAVTSTLNISNLEYITGGGKNDPGDDQPAESNLTIESYGNTYKSGDKWSMSTSSGSISQYQLENSLKLSTGVLDTSLQNTKTAINVTEGSGLLAIATGKSGDTVTFDYTFSTNDYSPYKDYSFVSINGSTKNIAAIGQEVASYGSITSSYSYTLQDSDFANSSDTVEISLGVVDALDTAVSSNFSVWDLALTSATNGETPTPDPTPEPTPDPTPEPTPEPTGEIEFQGYGNAFKGSNGLISMSTGYGSISQMQVEQNLGLTLGELDSDLNASKTAINATEGSAINASFEASAGDIVSFNYVFGTSDYIPFQDYSFYSINGKSQSLAVVGVDTPNYGSTSGIVNYTITDEDINNADGSNIQFSVGIMDALDTVVDSYLVLSDFKVSNSESNLDDIDGNGLLDGSDAYMASATSNVSSSIKITDSENNTLSNQTSSNWNLDGLVGSFSISSPAIDLLAQGTGLNAGKVALWQADATGTLTQDIDSLDNSTDWVSIQEAVENGYEEKFGNDLNNDGIISSAIDDWDNVGIALKNGAASADDVILKSSNGETISQSGTSTFEVKKSIANGGFSIFNSTSVGYQILVKGKGSKSGKYGIAEVDKDGIMDNILWKSGKDIENLEAQFDLDLNKDSLINDSNAYKLAGSSGVFTLKNQKGITYNDNSKKWWDVNAAKETEAGFQVLLKTDFKNKNYNKIKIWDVDKKGIFVKESNWTKVTKAVDQGLENKFKTDFDGNGLITNKWNYKLASSTGPIKLKNKWGKVYQVDKTKKWWNGTAAVETEYGYKVLLTGAKDTWMDGKVKRLWANKDGITKWSGKWKTKSWATAKGWEDVFKVDINNNNVIETKMSAQLSSDLLINPSTQTSSLMADINQNTEYISTTMQGLAPQEAPDTQMPLTIQLSAQGSNADTLLNQNETFLS